MHVPCIRCRAQAFGLTPIRLRNLFCPPSSHPPLSILTSDMQHKIIILGELLWDCFEQSKKAAGAPFNFAKHALSCGLSPLLISAVGLDEDGTELINAVQNSSVCSNISRVQSPTGKAIVHTTNCHNSFELIEPAAWDEIALPPETLDIIPSASALYFGTLAQRAHKTRQTIQNCAKLFQNRMRICDINLRPPFITNDIILWSLAHCNILKMSDEETPQIAQLLSLSPNSTPDHVVQTCFNQFPIDIIVETRGPNGAAAWHRNGTSATTQAQSITNCSTVGAGDAFIASFSAQILQQSPLQTALETAVIYASSVIANPSYTSPHPV